MKLIEGEIHSCEDLKELREQLMRVTKLFMTHQQLLDRCLEQLLASEVDKLLTGDVEDEQTNASD